MVFLAACLAVSNPGVSILRMLGVFLDPTIEHTHAQENAAAVADNSEFACGYHGLHRFLDTSEVGPGLLDCQQARAE